MISARESGEDPYALIENLIGWERFVASVSEAEELAMPPDFDYLDHIQNQYRRLRNYAPALLEAFEFEAASPAKPLLEALDVLKEMNASAFASYGARILTVPVDRRGMDVEVVREILVHERRAGSRIKFVYTIPTFQNPTGATMTPERRREILELAREHDLLILEDNPYGLLRYEGEPLETLAALELRERGEPEHVVYLGSFSKVFAPGVRLGWVHAHPDVLGALRAVKKGTDLGPSAHSQVLTTAYFEGGEWRSYLERLKRSYRRRRDAMLGALGEFMPDGVSWTSPEGGFFVWVTLPEGMDAAAMLPEAVARGVAYVPGEDFRSGGRNSSTDNTLRLSFSFAESRAMRSGISLLADLVREKSEGHDPAPLICGCDSESCDCTTALCTETLVGVVGC